MPKDGCPPGRCPDLTIRRHDTRPPFRVNVEDCDGSIDLEDLVLEANMWAKGRIKKAMSPTDTYFQLADNIGFEQVMIGDIVIMERARLPEHMLVTGFDEDNYLVRVLRGYNGTTPGTWKKGSSMRIFRVLNSPAQTELKYEDIEQTDGTILKNQLTDSFLVYEWQPQDTCLPGCYWLEFKLLKMKDRQFFLPGGRWTGLVHTDQTGSYFTGQFGTGSSVGVSVGTGPPDRLIAQIRESLPSPLYADPNFIEPVTPTPDQSNYDLWRYIVRLYPSPDDVSLRWQIWDHLVHLNLQGEFYRIPSNVHWIGPVHMWTDGNWYSGTSHDDGSVYLDVNGLVSPPDASYNASGLVSVLSPEPTVGILGCSIASVVPSFASISGISDASSIPRSISQIDRDFGCDLGAGVEWVRRYPLDSEAFLVKITDSPTSE